jgi:hypothetical protein
MQFTYELSTDVTSNAPAFLSDGPGFQVSR